MCGRYTLTRLADLSLAFPWIDQLPEGRAQYNIAPTQPVLVISNDHPDAFDRYAWGLVPFWAKDPSIGGKMCNARAETVADKPAFRNVFRRRRCLVPADGFYEWRKVGSAKTPMYIQMKSHAPFAFAGLWDSWRDDAGSELRTCTILTTGPNALMESIHDRMPVIIPPDAYQRWLSKAEKKPEELNDLLAPYPAKQMEAHPVSKLVNSVKNDSAENVVEAAPESLFG